jgi:hypothetical protein
MHIRRTDKVTAREAQMHDVDEYMTHAERFCDWKLGTGWQLKAAAAAAAAAASPSPGANKSIATAAFALDQTPERCSIYLATDEPAVAKEIKSRFGHIHVITNKVGLDTGEAWFVDGWFCNHHKPGYTPHRMPWVTISHWQYCAMISCLTACTVFSTPG